MKISFGTRLTKMLTGFALAGLATTWAVGKVMDPREVASRETSEIGRITQKMNTLCVGRFLIDLPKEAQIELRQARIDGFDIAAFDETEEDFQKRLADREAQITAIPDRLGGNENLESAKEVKTNRGLIGKIFLHSRTVSEGTQGNGLGVERYRDEGISTEALVHGLGLSIDLLYEDRALQWVEELPRLVNQLVPNPDNRIPAEPGFCMDRVYARDPIKADQNEQIMLFARLPSHPDIEFMLMLSAGLKPDVQGLLERSDAADGRLSFAERMRISRSRAGLREIGGLRGEELVESVVEENDARVHTFWWEVNGTENDVLIPHIVFKMTTGNSANKPVPSSLSDGAALALWTKYLPESVCVPPCHRSAVSSQCGQRRNPCVPATPPFSAQLHSSFRQTSETKLSHRRYTIRAGATTSAGGTVRASSAFSLLDGQPVAREGDPVDCPACGTEGTIGCAGPRTRDRFEGREYALSDDLCICACTPAPTLIADQADEFQIVDA